MAIKNLNKLVPDLIFLSKVSTWFANARRRLKKENKMTWVPKNRTNTDQNNESKNDEDEEESASSAKGA